jgi:LPXTG-site transpeptidase (sortase) family protein
MVVETKGTSPAPVAPPEENGRNPWRIVQFGLAAASAIPLLWVGGLNGWPWENGSTAKSGAAVADPAVPVSIEIGRLKIDAPLDRLTMDAATQELNPPAYGRAGWNQSGPEPGTVGRAVVEGHRTNQSGSSDVFAKLSDVKTGDRIVVTTSGKPVDFTVTSVETFDTSAVPMARVFGSDGKTAQLRVIAPSGTASGDSYRQDVIVFADRAS